MTPALTEVERLLAVMRATQADMRSVCDRLRLEFQQRHEADRNALMADLQGAITKLGTAASEATFIIKQLERARDDLVADAADPSVSDAAMDAAIKAGIAASEARIAEGAAHVMA